MARPLLEAVIFDAGGTLVRLDYEWIALMLAGLGLTVDAGTLRAAEVEGRRRFDAAARPGAPAPVEAYWGGMLEAAGCPRATRGTALARMGERQASDAFLWARPMEGARRVLDVLPELGLRLACVSNSDGRAEEHLVRYGVREGLEFVIDSHLVGVAKPDPRIFELALRRMDILPERALYVGDLHSVDALGSRAAGMRCVLLDPSGTYATDGTPGIAGIGQLPGYIAAQFVTPAESKARST